MLFIFSLVSSTDLSVDEILKEFRTTKEKRNNKKLMKILEVLISNQPNGAEHLQDLGKLLEKFVVNKIRMN